MTAVLDLNPETDLVSELEHLLDNEPRCEARRHSLSEVKIPCSLAGVALVRGDCYPRTLLICQNLVEAISARAAGGGKCAKCARPIPDCWSVIPL
jgi:hypothetical protein